MTVTQRTDYVSRQIKELLVANAGKVFTVTFKKADGSMRTLNCKHGHVKGHDGKNTTAHIEKYLTVRTMDGQFKNVNCETVSCVKMGGRTISFA